MADWVKVESQMRKLISDANATTEKNDTNLTDCVGSLISGYGQGSGSDVSSELSIAEEGVF